MEVEHHRCRLEANAIASGPQRRLSRLAQCDRAAAEPAAIASRRKEQCLTDDLCLLAGRIGEPDPTERKTG